MVLSSLLNAYSLYFYRIAYDNVELLHHGMILVTDDVVCIRHLALLAAALGYDPEHNLHDGGREGGGGSAKI